MVSRDAESAERSASNGLALRSADFASRLTIDQNDANVHYIRLGQARLEQVAGRLEEMIGIVPFQRVVGLKGATPVPRLRIRNRAGRVGRPVFAVGAAAED